MGNAGSHRHRQASRRNHPPSQPEVISGSIVFAAATPYPNPNPNPGPLAGYYQYHPPVGYYPPPPMPPGQGPLRMPLPAPYDHHHQVTWTGRYPPPPPPPYVGHEKAVTIRNDINLKKDTVRVEPDQENPGKWLLAFTFDATVAGSISVIYFSKEGEECKLTPTKENILPQVTIHFQRGLGQKFIQPSGTGIDFSMFEESELMKGDKDVCPLAVKADACLPPKQSDTGSDDNALPDGTNSQITQVVFEKDREGYKVKVLKQILWVNQMRYELQEIYGVGNSMEGEVDDNDPGKECVICLSEPRDTTVLPCRHMCMCNECAKVLRFQTNRCPICRQPVERLLEIKVSNANDEEKTAQSAE